MSKVPLKCSRNREFKQVEYRVELANKWLACLPLTR